MDRYTVYKQNKKWAPVILIVLLLALGLLMYVQHFPLKKAEVEDQHGSVVSLPIAQTFSQSQSECPELNMPCTLTLKMFSKEEVKASVLTQFGGWREMKTFPTENEDERALLGLEAWAMHEYYIKVEQGNYKAYLHFKIVKSINDS